MKSRLSIAVSRDVTWAPKGFRPAHERGGRTGGFCAAGASRVPWQRAWVARRSGV